MTVQDAWAAQGVRILVIEDDPAASMTLREQLEHHGYSVVVKPNGADGLQYVQGHDAHLIILKAQLRDGSGIDLCRQMRLRGVRQPILILTAHPDELDIVLSLEMGADDSVCPPYRPREILSRVRALLRRAYGELSLAHADVLHVGDLVIDRGRAKTWRQGREIALTPTEFRLLTYLAQHVGQTLSRGQIIDAVWGYGAALEDDRVVNVHIRRLRQKVEPDPARPSLILTARGMGYRLVG